MNISLFTYTKNGLTTALKVLDCFEEAEKKAYVPERFSQDGFFSQKNQNEKSTHHAV